MLIARGTQNGSNWFVAVSKMGITCGYVQVNQKLFDDASHVDDVVEGIHGGCTFLEDYLPVGDREQWKEDGVQYIGWDYGHPDDVDSWNYGYGDFWGKFANLSKTKDIPIFHSNVLDDVVIEDAKNIAMKIAALEVNN